MFSVCEGEEFSSPMIRVDRNIVYLIIATLNLFA